MRWCTFCEDLNELGRFKSKSCFCLRAVSAAVVSGSDRVSQSCRCSEWRLCCRAASPELSDWSGTRGQHLTFPGHCLGFILNPLPIMWLTAGSGCEFLFLGLDIFEGSPVWKGVTRMVRAIVYVDAVMWPAIKSLFWGRTCILIDLLCTCQTLL